MLGKVIELKPAARRKDSASPARSSLADVILQQFLAEADAPNRNPHAQAQILEFSPERKGRVLRVISQVQLNLSSPFTLAYWLRELVGPANPKS